MRKKKLLVSWEAKLLLRDTCGEYINLKGRCFVEICFKKMFIEIESKQKLLW